MIKLKNNINLIKYHREEKGYTQEDLSKILDITLRNYQYIEHKKSTPNVITALKLCKVLNINPYNVWKID